MDVLRPKNPQADPSAQARRPDWIRSVCRRWVSLGAVIGASLVVWLGLPNPAAADVVHVVGKGEKIGDIAKKYGVTPKAIASTNKLKESGLKGLKVGSKLVIPGKPGSTSKVGAAAYTMLSKDPGRATFLRLGSRERFELQLVKKTKLVPGILPRMARVMRFGPLGLEHKIDPRLVTLLAQVSDHFGGRPLEVISGFRPKTPTQYTPHSNHNIGRAMDFRIPGVPNEVLRDYCRTFKSTGVGYYPNSLFVHFDVRKDTTYWVDLSKPGEAPKYVGKDVDADHAADDAKDDTKDDPKVELKLPESKADSKAEIKPDPKPELKIEPKADTKM